jgi:KRAB domain-containing zinc finger protein
VSNLQSCQTCKVSFADRKLYNEHMDSVHEGKKPYQCDLCGTTISTKYSLEKHMKLTHEETDLKHHCHICSKAFKNTNYLPRHIQAVHEGKKPFQCNVCSCAFYGKFKLEQHIQGVHEGTKPYHCHSCDSKFYFPSAMKEHIARIHEGKIPEKIKCSICEKLVASKGSLKKHIEAFQV